MGLVLKKPMDRKPLGQVLVERGLLTEADRDSVLKRSEETHKRFGQQLISDGYINDLDLAHCVAEVFNLNFLDLGDVTPTPESLAEIPYALAKQYCVCPLSLENEELVLCTNDPLNVNQISQNIRLKKLSINISSESQIRALIEKSYKQGAAQEVWVKQSPSLKKMLPQKNYLMIF